jgi:hypothetical protein
MEKLVTKESLERLLHSEDADKQMRACGRALVVLFKLQTASERQSNDTNEDNGVGFTGADGRQGAISAKYFIKHDRLEDWMVEKWIKPGKKGTRLGKYWKQLNIAANAKADAQARQQQRALV